MNIEITIGDHKFSAEDPFLLELLPRAVEEEDTPGINEGNLIVRLPLIFSKNTGQNIRSASINSGSYELAFDVQIPSSICSVTNKQNKLFVKPSKT